MMDSVVNHDTKYIPPPAETPTAALSQMDAAVVRPCTCRHVHRSSKPSTPLSSPVSSWRELGCVDLLLQLLHDISGKGKVFGGTWCRIGR
eukprot:243897-Chlamydomonas_euryale.AAC.1